VELPGKLEIGSSIANSAIVVKFDNIDQLPPILNALETDNGGNKLILEVAVRANHWQKHTEEHEN
jgi:F0F1-type ATP synthase beta subunit